jgi:cytochrome c553
MKYPISIGLFLAIFATSAVLAEVVSSTQTHSNSPHIRTLSASCAACHGTQGNSVGVTPTLAGLDGNYLVTQMLAFKEGSRASTVMLRHAKGLNLDEINLLADYFSQQKRVTNATPSPQKLKANHE